MPYKYHNPQCDHIYPVSLHRYTISSVLGQFSHVRSSQIQLHVFEYSLFENISGGKNDGRSD